jgi:hypothetical protein
MVHDLRVLLRLAAGRAEQPTGAIFDSRTLQSSVESGERAGYDGLTNKIALKSGNWLTVSFKPLLIVYSS